MNSFDRSDQTDWEAIIQTEEIDIAHTQLGLGVSKERERERETERQKERGRRETGVKRTEGWR
jgi:hypothetical protein